MFQNIICINAKYPNTNWRICDEDFTCEVSVPYSRFCLDIPHIPYQAAAIIREYGKRKLPVAKNIALMFVYCAFIPKEFRQYISGRTARLDWLEARKTRIDQLFPELEYGMKYHRCVVNNFERLLCTDI